MVQTERSANGPSQKAAGHKGSFSLSFGSLALAFAVGAVLSAWGTYILTQSLATPPAGNTVVAANSKSPFDAQKQKANSADKSGKSETPDKSDQAKKDSEKSASPANPADKATDFDPAAEAARINELNRRNRERTAGGQAGPMTPGARPAGGSAIPNPSAAPGTYGPTAPQIPEN
jgi:hypothetical protein